MSEDIDFRRRWLVCSGLTASVAVAAAEGEAGEHPQPSVDANRDLIFETTEHVRAYYRRARG